MPRPYSDDLRIRAVEKVLAGESRCSVAKQIGVAVSTQRKRISKFLGELRGVGDELEATIRRLSRPQEAPPDRQLVVHLVHDAHDQAADRREILRAVARPVPEVVLPHLDVQNPMQPVLDRPVVPALSTRHT